jgi:hypothetical protein
MKKKLWIQEATKHKGALHKNLGIPEGTKIPKDKLEAAAKRSGKIGSEARLALTLEKINRKTNDK